TDHFSEWCSTSAAGTRLRARCAKNGVEVFTTIITSQESSEGWFALINRHPPGQQQVPIYGLYQRSQSALGDMFMLPFDYESALRFESARLLRLRVGTMDLKIAAICLAHAATLLSRNAGDFTKVPGLQFENWLD
ncbi:MAG TPA: hypothetical protein DDZ88_26165, partial [Verrucomicrobiales bacterium]|nr:hypothetical protein [Verrucomicrobiales bacterium]